MPSLRPTSATSPRIEPTWWAPITLICALGFYVPFLVPATIEHGGYLEPLICVVGLAAAVMAVRHERRLGWKVASILAGLFHLCVVAFFLYLIALLQGWVTP